MICEAHSQFYKIHLPLFVSDGDANGLAELVIAPVYGVFETVLNIESIQMFQIMWIAS